MSGFYVVTRDEMRQLEMLAARMSRDSRWQVTEAAFRLGLRIGVGRMLGQAQPATLARDGQSTKGGGYE